ncbi:uncharacterized protein V1513DRAFT_373871 [Lipomyces chichibuensis]|uniref:uncharacterized protein n=1 Tax=Lipomyces chichibuensis TaxID=1546026 RepID=UPI003343AD43
MTQSPAIHFGTCPVTSPGSHTACLAEISNRKRVGKACDACRIKKSKCDGRRPCSRCLAEDKICVFTDRKHSTEKFYSGPYVELLESRIKMLQQGIELLVQHINRGDNITSLLDDEGKISINKILDNLSVKCTDGNGWAGLKRSSTSTCGTSISALSDCDETDDVEGMESERDHARKRRRESEQHSGPQPIALASEECTPGDIPPMTAYHFDAPDVYPTSIGSSYSAFSDVPSLVSSPAITSPFSTSSSPELAHMSSLAFSLAPYSLDLLSPLANVDCPDKESGTSIDVWTASRLFESNFVDLTPAGLGRSETLKLN